MSNFLIIYPKQEIILIKQNYESLSLQELETHIIFVIDGLNEKEIQTFVEQINANLNYSCLMNTSLEKDIPQNIQFMSGSQGDKLFILKEGTVDTNVAKF